LAIVLNPYVFSTTPTVAGTWNPGDKSSQITLTNGNLTESNSSGVMAHVRATIGRSSSKRYFEYTVVAVTARVGLATSSFSLSTTSGADTTSCCYLTGNATTRHNGVNAPYPTAWGPPNDPGNIISVAADLDVLKVWFRVNGGQWFGRDISIEDPATGLGGLTLLASGTWFPLGGGLNHEGTINLGASAFAYTVPVGFSAWDD